MSDRLSRSWQLTRASWAVLKQDRQLLLFPLISSGAAGVVLATFGLAAFGYWVADGMSGHPADRLPVLAYVIGFLFYVALYFIVFFFNAALVGAALIRFDGGTPTLRDGLRVARARIGRILGYAVIAATVGMLLRAIQERVGFLGRIVVGFLGAGWTVATFLVVPVLVSREVGPIDAVKESALILKKTWGENVVGQAGMGLAFVLAHLAVGCVGIACVIAAAVGGHPWLLGSAIVFTVVAEGLLALVHAALSGIYAAALYRFAAGGGATGGFDPSTLQAAFAAKR